MLGAWAQLVVLAAERNDLHRRPQAGHGRRAYLATGADPATLARDTRLTGVKIGSWLARQLTTWQALTPGRQQLMTALGRTPAGNPLAPARSTPRTFEETVQLLELFLHREGRLPAARETVRVDGDTVEFGAWLAKARTEHRSKGCPLHRAARGKPRNRTALCTVSDVAVLGDVGQSGKPCSVPAGRAVQGARPSCAGVRHGPPGWARIASSPPMTMATENSVAVARS